MTEPVVLKDPASGSSARIAAHLGFNCYEFQAVVSGRTIGVIDAAPDFAAGHQRPSGHGIPILFPFPNRIRDGRYSWDGREYVLPEPDVMHDPTGNVIHGFCLDRPWRVTAQDLHFVTGEFRLSRDAADRLEFWPADFTIEVRYELRGPVLRADVRIANPDDKPLPWGFGTHPYFHVPLAPQSDAARCLVEIPASEQWELVDCLPSGRRVPVPTEKDLSEGQYLGKLRLDDVYSGLKADDGVLECLIYDESAGLQVLQRCPSHFREIVAFTPSGRDAVCLEPYTCVTDAINLQPQGIDAGLQVLPPGGEFRTWIEIRAGLIIV